MSCSAFVCHPSRCGHDLKWLSHVIGTLPQIERTELSITLVSAENVRNARATQRSDVADGAQAGVFIKRLPPGG